MTNEQSLLEKTFKQLIETGASVRGVSDYNSIMDELISGANSGGGKGSLIYYMLNDIASMDLETACKVRPNSVRFQTPYSFGLKVVANLIRFPNSYKQENGLNPMEVMLESDDASAQKWMLYTSGCLEIVMTHSFVQYETIRNYMNLVEKQIGKSVIDKNTGELGEFAEYSPQIGVYLIGMGDALVEYADCDKLPEYIEGSVALKSYMRSQPEKRPLEYLRLAKRAYQMSGYTNTVYVGDQITKIEQRLEACNQRQK
ncbi:MAG: hypothetical protein V1859_03640 [archaeon]